MGGARRSETDPAIDTQALYWDKRGKMSVGSIARRE